MNDKKVLIVTTVASTIKGFLYPHIDLLKEKGYEVLLATNFAGNEYIRAELLDKNCKVYDISFSRNPLKIFESARALKQLRTIAEMEEINVLYTHTPIASFLSRYAFRKKNIKVIYFAHGLHFFKGANFKNWFLFYPLEKVALRWTDLVITINKEDYLRLSELKTSTKVILLPGVGLDEEFIKTTSKISTLSRRELLAYTDLNSFLDPQDFIILSVGELNDNKNHIDVIKAVEKLVISGDENLKYLIVGKGPNWSKLKKYIENHQLTNNVKLLGYRKDVAYLLQLSDILVSMSYREGLPVSIMEAMVIGKPVLVTDIRGHCDLIENEFMRIPIKEINVTLPKKLELIKNNKLFLEEEGITNKEKSKKYYLSNVIEKLSSIF